MQEKYIKEIKIDAGLESDSYKELMKNIETVKLNLEMYYNNMQMVEDKNLVDYYTYKIKSEEAQYNFLIGEAKKLETGLYL